VVASQLISKFRRPQCHQRWVSIFRAPRLPRRPNGFCVTSIAGPNGVAQLYER
jgi:hypothetical protein